MKIHAAILILIITTVPALYSNENQQTDSEILKKLQDDYWQRQLKDNLYWRLKYGLPVEELPDLSFKKAKENAELAHSIMDRLKKIPTENLNHEEKLSTQILEWENRTTIQALPFFYLNSPLTPYATQLTTIQRVFTEFQFKSNGDTDRYLKLLNQFGKTIESCEQVTSEQAKLGIVIPKEELKLVLPFLESMKQSPEKSIFNVATDRLSAVSKQAFDFQKSVQQMIEKEVNPALDDLTDFLEGDYDNKAPTKVGLSQYPLGNDYYRFLVRYHTTMDIAPQEVHRIGLQRMEAIHREMQEIQQQLGFQGTRAEFQKTLRKNPKLYAKKPEEIGERLMFHVRRIEPRIKEYFLGNPRAPYGVKRLNPALEGSMTFGYYQEPTPTQPTGFYFYNGSKLDERSMLDAASLVFHELVPGHHFQSSLQTENNSLPEFRRNSWYTAYGEGWAEYATDLADEMGMYNEPLDRYGYLGAKSFLTARLVVDTGMNALGWTREKAVDYLRQNTLMSEAEIHTETLRYCCDIPGQALGYRMGAGKIYDLREKARKEMGDRFDIRKFHDAVLGSGSMPLTVLEEHIDWFIKQ